MMSYCYLEMANWYISFIFNLENWTTQWLVSFTSPQSSPGSIFKLLADSDTAGPSSWTPFLLAIKRWNWSLSWLWRLGQNSRCRLSWSGFTIWPESYLQWTSSPLSNLRMFFFDVEHLERWLVMCLSLHFLLQILQVTSWSSSSARSKNAIMLRLMG